MINLYQFQNLHQIQKVQVNHKQIAKLFEYFYQKYHNDYFYRVRLDEKTEKLIDTFILSLDKKYGIESIGINFMIDYFLFSWQFWDDVNKVSDKNKTIKIDWVIGSKAFKRWCNRDIEFDWQFPTLEIVEKLKIRKHEIKALLDWNQELYFKISKAEEDEKKRFYNTDRGFLNCIEKTSLYNPSSSNCIGCKFSKDCKELLKKNYNKLYIERIDE